MPTKYGFTTDDDHEQQAQLQEFAVLKSWVERDTIMEEEQGTLREVADSIAPQVEDVLRDWPVSQDSVYTDDPHVARTEDGTGWALFGNEAQRLRGHFLWWIYLRRDWTKKADPPVLVVNGHAGRSEIMVKVLSEVTGLMSRQHRTTSDWETDPEAGDGSNPYVEYHVRYAGWRRLQPENRGATPPPE